MAITYQTLYDQTLSQIKSACLNVSNYTLLPSAYKSGYSEITEHPITFVYGNTTHTLNTQKVTVTPKNPISQIATSVVNTDFKTFMNACGFGTTIPLSSETTARGCVSFYNAVASFVQKNVCYVQGRNKDKCIVYVRNYTSGSTGITANVGALIVSDDITNVNNVLSNIITNTARTVSMTYNFVLS